MKQTTWIKQTDKVIAKKHEHRFSSWHPRALALVRIKLVLEHEGF